MTIKPQLKSIKDRVSLNWTQINAVVTGVSAIDVTSLAIRNRQEAVQFAREYGFDVDDPTDYEHICDVHREAVEFIEEFFLEPGQGHLISEEVRNPENVLDLLVYSSNYLNKSNHTQMWACAVLKVMHGIFHIDHDMKLRYFDKIRVQIFQSLDSIIVNDGDNDYLCDDRMKIPIFYFEKKRNKGRRSILLKLLQKPTYVAADIYDHLGIRLVFETKMECLFALKVLRRSHLISVTNIKPFRSRNNLIDLKSTKELFSHFRPLLERARDYPMKVLKDMDRELAKRHRGGARVNNPHSDEGFQTIQVTARKMVRVPNPAHQGMNSLLELLENNQVDVPEELVKEARFDKDFAFYFDYEIQLLDKMSYLKTMHGPASHTAYKKRQVETARKRVLSPALRKIILKETAIAGD
ncbi:MAG: TIGR04552 family protein [Acidobacteriota bacterium]|nr:TIGR04552 family protein [Acidobacteriota bacterium]